MENVKFKQVDGQLHIIVDPGVDLGLSSTGKSHIVAKTGGRYGQKVRLPGGEEITVNLNVYRQTAVPAGTVVLD